MFDDVRKAIDSPVAIHPAQTVELAMGAIRRHAARFFDGPMRERFARRFEELALVRRAEGDLAKTRMALAAALVLRDAELEVSGTPALWHLMARYVDLVEIEAAAKAAHGQPTGPDEPDDDNLIIVP